MSNTVVTTSKALALSCLLLPLAAMAADAGSVTNLQGRVEIIHGQNRLTAGQGQVIAAGDTILTSGSGRANLRMVDDSYFALANNTEFSVDELLLTRTGANPQPGNAVFSLVKGAFRTVTGLISKGSGDRYEVRTAVATIGVRGSAYATIICTADCAAKAKVPAGLYVKAEAGLITLKNDNGTLTLRAGQVGYVASSAAGPIRVDKSPFNYPDIHESTDLYFDLQDLLVQPPVAEPPVSPS